MKSKHILIVDDEKIMRDLISRSLNPLGCRIFLASDGIEGLETLQREKIDVLISDIKMPRMDGVSFMQTALERQPGLAALFITGHADTMTRREARDMGVADLIIKPFKNTEIILSIRRALSLARLSHSQTKTE